MEFLRKNNSKFRMISMYIGAGLLILAGLLFIIIVDLKVNKFDPIVYGDGKEYQLLLSFYLLMAAVFALGSGIFYMYGDSVKNKHVATLVFKGIGIALAVAFIIFLFVFKARINWYRYPSQYFEGVSATKTYMSEAMFKSANGIITACLVIDIVGIVVYILNYLLSILFIEEDY